MPQNGHGGVKLCFADVYATWTQIAFCSGIVVILVLITVDLLTSCYTLEATENVLTWLDDKDMGTFLLIFFVFGAVSIVLLLPQTFLFLGAGYACAARIDNNYVAFVVALALSAATFASGASIAFLLARTVLPPSCTRRTFKHFAILDGLDHALRHRGRRINILLRANPLMPYNALNYGLGLSSSTFRAYLEGMAGAVPYTCVSVYAGMVISNVEDIDSLFEHTSVAWYCIYALLALLCVISMVLVVQYTKAEMEAAKAAGAAAAVANGGDGDGAPQGGGIDGGRDGGFGEPRGDATMFGTFTSNGHGNGEGRLEEGEDDDEEEMTTFDENVVSRLPLLNGDTRRKNAAQGDRPPAVQGRLSSFVDV